MSGTRTLTPNSLAPTLPCRRVWRETTSSTCKHVRSNGWAGDSGALFAKQISCRKSCKIYLVHTSFRCNTRRLSNLSVKTCGNGQKWLRRGDRRSGFDAGLAPKVKPPALSQRLRDMDCGVGLSLARDSRQWLGSLWLHCVLLWLQLGGSKDLSENAVGDRLGLARGNVGVANGGTDVGMAQRLLDEGQIGTVANQVAGIGVFQLMWAMASEIDADQFEALTEGIVDLLALDTGRLARGKQVFRAIVLTLPQPRRQHQLFVEQWVDVLAEFFDGVVRALATVAPDAPVLHVREAQAGDLAGPKGMTISQQEHAVVTLRAALGNAQNLQEIGGCHVVHGVPPQLCSHCSHTEVVCQAQDGRLLGSAFWVTECDWCGYTWKPITVATASLLDVATGSRYRRFMSDTPIRRLRMDDVLWHKAEKAAEDLDRTASWVIRQALEEFLERHRAGKQAERHMADRSAGVYVVQFDKQAASMLEGVSKSIDKEPAELIRIAVDRFLDRSQIK